MRCMGLSAKALLGKRVKHLREKVGLTQEQLAATTGIDYKYIQRIEGKTPPALRIDTIEKLAKAFKITCSKLLDF